MREQTVNFLFWSVLRIKTEDYPGGLYETNVSLGSPVFPGGWAKGSSEKPIKGDHCLEFWIGAYNNGTLEQAECFKIRPTWMSDNKYEFKINTSYTI